MFEALFSAYVAALYGNAFVIALAIAICADMVFGSLRAIKYRKWNSSVGIDGGIRKVGMVSAVAILTMVDMLLKAGISEDEIRTMICTNPKALLGIA